VRSTIVHQPVQMHNRTCAQLISISKLKVLPLTLIFQITTVDPDFNV
jgi:hypothetical protein